MYTNNEILFPNYVIPMMRDMRGPLWRDLVDRVIDLEDDHPEKLALVMTMIRFNGCMECETDSYRAMRGCVLCTAQMLRRYKGKDEELLEMYYQSLADVAAWVEEQRRIRIA